MKSYFPLFFLFFAISVNSAELTSEATKELKNIEWENLSIIDRITYKPNFFHDYEIVEWGCGSPCTQSVIINLKTGELVSFIDSCYGLNFSIESSIIKFENIPDDPVNFCRNEKVLKLVASKLIDAT
ncbi:hypothetical protein [Microbulbifer sp. SAOS-129_SWC]|uniref:hypothetical protein n=1 Tax=Microbulbifer sp. SAOS-129_SWC TaxID=3145235 RepID=UPI00321710BB